ncbi:amino acid ABC transporter membrane protein 2 (PAAT family) [Roseibium hamelinense]|uniref:Amino acid ABC transporter membrane protein 2 (PAAT family) n=1 Tax=Roseibium hamelinense TaxID=150831 RepID=A0A562T7E2_9HYPH|nr:ABC transporter permease [Roseibium hamelinense]MTI42108.1 ABC transporter permease [Roseibium hamelinense]TWI89529.1 amino acid ABC transporter membrane protein 2 (PAAT family) [Roseibium hamelinense]
MTAADPATGMSAPPPKARKWTGGRITGHVLMALWIVSGAYLVYYLALNIGSPFVQRYWGEYVDGFFITVQIVAISLAIGAALSIPIALARSSKLGIFRWPAYGYVYFFRGTPLLAQTFLIYYGAGTFRPELQSIGLWSFFRDAFNCVIFAFSLNTAAYQAEILRGAIQNVSRGQWEGGQALGLSKAVIFVKVILPQALMVALRPYGNEIILMIKGSAIASIVTIYDLMGETRRAFSRSYDFQAYIWAAVLYLLIVETLRRIWDKFEARLTRHLKR